MHAQPLFKKFLHREAFFALRHRVTAFFCLLTFVSTSVFIPSPVFAQSLEGQVEVLNTHSPLASLVSADTLAGLNLPTEIGKTEEIYTASGEAAQKQTVLLIQDAHAIPDAQKSIRSLIDYFQSQYGVNLVGLEGAQGKIDPTLLRLFPEKEILGKVFSDYLDRGELSGAMAASILNKEEADYFGAEKWDLYEKAIDEFLRALTQRQNFSKQLEEIENDLKTAKEKFYSWALLEFDKKVLIFDKDSADLHLVLETLKKFVMDYGFESKIKEFPQVEAVLLQLKEEDAANQNALRARLDRWTRDLTQTLTSKEETAEFQGRFQDYKTERMRPESFASYLFEFSRKKGLAPLQSREIEHAVSMEARIKQITGVQFFEELRGISQAVKEELLRTSEEKAIDALSGKKDLLSNLSNLKLSFREWEALKKLQPPHLSPLPLEGGEGGVRGESQRIVELAQKIQNLFSKLQKDYVSYIRFYELAEERDSAMTENLLKTMAENQAQVSVLVAGGFHAEGLKAVFKNKGISYALISPAMDQVPQDSRYFDFMQGRVSWAEHFEIRNGRIDLYEAFTRATVNRLLKQIQETDAHFGPVLKQWRDAVVKRLHEKGESAKTQQYTRFIDRAAAGLLNPERTEQLKQAWLGRVERFVEELRILKNENKLTPENILRVANQSTAQFPFAIPNGMIPASWAGGQPSVISEEPAPSLEQAGVEPALRSETRRPPETGRTTSAAKQGKEQALLDRKSKLFRQVVHDVFASLLERGVSGFDLRERLPGLKEDVNDVIASVEEMRGIEIDEDSMHRILNRVAENLILEFEERLIRGLIEKRISSKAIYDFLDDPNVSKKRSFRTIESVFERVQEKTLKIEAPFPHFQDYLIRVARKLAKEERLQERYTAAAKDEMLDAVLEARLPGKRTFNVKAAVFASAIFALVALGTYARLKERPFVRGEPSSVQDTRGPPEAKEVAPVVQEDPRRFSEKEIKMAFKTSIDLNAPLDLRLAELEIIIEAVLQSFYPDATWDEIDNAKMYWLRVAYHESDELETKVQYEGGAGAGLWQVETWHDGEGSSTAETMLRRVLKGDLIQYKDLAIDIYGSAEKLEYFSVNSDLEARKDKDNQKNSAELRELMIGQSDAAAFLLALLIPAGDGLTISDIPKDLNGQADFWATHHWRGPDKKRPDRIKAFMDKAKELDEELEKSRYRITMTEALRNTSSPALQFGAMLSDSILAEAAVRSEARDSDEEFADALFEELRELDFEAVEAYSLALKARDFQALQQDPEFKSIDDLITSLAEKTHFDRGLKELQRIIDDVVRDLEALQPQSRRQFLKWGLAAAGLTALGGTNWFLVNRARAKSEFSFDLSRNQLEVVAYQRNQAAQKEIKDLKLPMFNTNVYWEGETGRTTVSGLIRTGEAEQSFNPNGKGFAQAKAIFLIHKTGRVQIIEAPAFSGNVSRDIRAFEEKYPLSEWPHAFQAGPMAVKGGILNARLFDTEEADGWYTGWRHGRVVVLGTDAQGSLHTKEIFGRDILGITGLSKQKFKEILQKWQADHQIQQAMFVDGGSTGILTNPPYVLVVRPQPRSETRGVENVRARLKQNGIKPEEITTLIYYASGGDTTLPAFVQRDIAPNLKKIYYIALSYRTESIEKEIEAEILKALGPAAGKGVEIFTYPESYETVHLALEDEGYRLWVDKVPGDMSSLRSNPKLYLNALEKQHIRFGKDIVMTADVDEPNRPHAWKNRIVEGFKLKGYWDQSFTYSFAIPAREDYETLQKRPKRFEGRSYSLDVPGNERKKTVQTQNEFYKAIRQWVKKYPIYQMVVMKQAEDGREIPRDAYRFMRGAKKWEPWIKKYESSMFFPAELELEVVDGSEWLIKIIIRNVRSESRPPQSVGGQEQAAKEVWRSESRGVEKLQPEFLEFFKTGKMQLKAEDHEVFSFRKENKDYLAPGSSSIYVKNGESIVGEIHFKDNSMRYGFDVPSSVAVAVSPDYKRRGLGSVLMFLAMQSARQNGFNKFYLYQVTEEAESFYESLGFKKLKDSDSDYEFDLQTQPLPGTTIFAARSESRPPAGEAGEEEADLALPSKPEQPVEQKKLTPTAEEMEARADRLFVDLIQRINWNQAAGRKAVMRLVTVLTNMNPSVFHNVPPLKLSPEFFARESKKFSEQKDERSLERLQELEKAYTKEMERVRRKGLVVSTATQTVFQRLGGFKNELILELMKEVIRQDPVSGNLINPEVVRLIRQAAGETFIAATMDLLWHRYRLKAGKAMAIEGLGQEKNIVEILFRDALRRDHDAMVRLMMNAPKGVVVLTEKEWMDLADTIELLSASDREGRLKEIADEYAPKPGEHWRRRWLRLEADERIVIFDIWADQKIWIYLESINLDRHNPTESRLVLRIEDPGADRIVVQGPGRPGSFLRFGGTLRSEARPSTPARPAGGGEAGKRSEMRDETSGNIFSDFSETLNRVIPSRQDKASQKDEILMGSQDLESLQLFIDQFKALPDEKKSMLKTPLAERWNPLPLTEMVDRQKPQEHLSAFHYRGPEERHALVVVNHNRYGRKESGFVKVDLEALGVKLVRSHYYLFHDTVNGRSYLRRGSELQKQGLFVSPENGRHIFWVEDISKWGKNKIIWLKLLSRIGKTLGGRGFDAGLLAEPDSANGIRKIYSQIQDTTYASEISELRYIRVDFLENGNIRNVRVSHIKRQLEAEKGDFIILQGESGARAAAVLAMLLSPDSKAQIEALRPIETETAQFLDRLTEVAGQIHKAVGSLQNAKIERLPVTDGQDKMVVFAVTGTSEAGKETRFLLAINLSTSRKNEKEFATVALPDHWVYPNQRTVHELTDLAPSLFGLQPALMQYTQTDMQVRLGLIPHSFPSQHSRSLWMHLFEVNSRPGPKSSVFIHNDATSHAAVWENAFSPPSGKVTRFKLGDEITVRGRVVLNDADGKIIDGMAPEEVEKAIIAEAGHNFNYTAQEWVPAHIVKEASHPGHYVFEAKISGPTVPGMFWVNMRYRVRDDIAGETLYSIPDNRRAVVMVDIPESYRQIQNDEARLKVAAAHIEAQNLITEDTLSRELKEKATRALAFSLKDAAKTGEIFAASTFEGTPERRIQNYSYLYTWIRDAAQIFHEYFRSENPEIRKIAENFLNLLWQGHQDKNKFTDQRWRVVNGKVVRPVTSFNDPQSDGPAHAGMVALEYLRAIREGFYRDDAKQREKAITLINASMDEMLKMVKNAYLFLTLGAFMPGEDPRGFDIWEEIYGLHFANFVMVYSFLTELRLELMQEPNLLPRQLFDKLDAPLIGTLSAREMVEDILRNQFRMQSDTGLFPRHLVAHRKAQNAEQMDFGKHQERLDAQLLWALVSSEQIPMEHSDPLALGAYNSLRNLFTNWGGFNHEIRKRFPQVVAMGRYDADVYDGTHYNAEEAYRGAQEIGTSGGHYWFIATLWPALFDLKFARQEIEKGRFDVNSPAYVDYLKNLLQIEGYDFNSTGIEIGKEILPDNPVFGMIARAIQARVDQTLAFVSGYITEKGGLYEQFRKDNGAAQGIADLNWSNITFAQAVVERDRYLKFLKNKNITTTRSETRPPTPARPAGGGEAGDSEAVKDEELAEFIEGLDAADKKSLGLVQELVQIAGSVSYDRLSEIKPLNLSNDFFPVAEKAYEEDAEARKALRSFEEVLDAEMAEQDLKNYNQLALLGMMTLRDPLFLMMLKNLFRRDPTTKNFVNPEWVRIFRETADQSIPKEKRQGFVAAARDVLEGRLRFHPRDQAVIQGFGFEGFPVTLEVREISGQGTPRAVVDVTAPPGILFEVGHVWKNIEKQIKTGEVYSPRRIQRLIQKQRRRVSNRGLIQRALHVRLNGSIVFFDSKTHNTIQLQVEDLLRDRTDKRQSALILKRLNELPPGVMIRRPERTSSSKQRSEMRLTPEEFKPVSELELKLSTPPVIPSEMIREISPQSLPRSETRDFQKEYQLIYELDDAARNQSEADPKFVEIIRELIARYPEANAPAVDDAGDKNAVVASGSILARYLRKHMIQVKEPLEKKLVELNKRAKNMPTQVFVKSEKEKRKVQAELDKQSADIKREAESIDMWPVQQISFDLLKTHLILDMYYRLQNDPEATKKRIPNNEEVLQLLSFNQGYFNETKEDIHSQLLSLYRIYGLSQVYDELGMGKIRQLALEKIIVSEEAHPSLVFLASMAYNKHLATHYVPMMGQKDLENTATMLGLALEAGLQLMEDGVLSKTPEIDEQMEVFRAGLIKYFQHMKTEDKLRAALKALKELSENLKNASYFSMAHYETSLLLAHLIQDKNPSEAAELYAEANRLGDETIRIDPELSDATRGLYHQYKSLEIRLLQADRSALPEEERKRELTAIRDELGALVPAVRAGDDDFLRMTVFIGLMTANAKLQAKDVATLFAREFFQSLVERRKEKFFFQEYHEFTAGIPDAHLLMLASEAGNILLDFKNWPENGAELGEMIRMIWQQDPESVLKILSEAVYRLAQSGEDPKPYQERLISIFQEFVQIDSERARTLAFQMIIDFKQESPETALKIETALKEEAKQAVKKKEEFISDFLMSGIYDSAQGLDRPRRILRSYIETALLASEYEASAAFHVIEMIDRHVKETWYFKAQAKASLYGEAALVIDAYLRRLQAADPVGHHKLTTSLRFYLQGIFEKYKEPHRHLPRENESLGLYYLLLAGLYESVGLQTEANAINRDMAEHIRDIYLDSKKGFLVFKNVEDKNFDFEEAYIPRALNALSTMLNEAIPFDEDRNDPAPFANKRIDGKDDGEIKVTSPYLHMWALLFRVVAENLDKPSQKFTSRTNQQNTQWVLKSFMNLPMAFRYEMVIQHQDVKSWMRKYIHAVVTKQFHENNLEKIRALAMVSWLIEDEAMFKALSDQWMMEDLPEYETMPELVRASQYLREFETFFAVLFLAAQQKSPNDREIFSRALQKMEVRTAEMDAIVKKHPSLFQVSGIYLILKAHIEMVLGQEESALQWIEQALNVNAAPTFQTMTELHRALLNDLAGNAELAFDQLLAAIARQIELEAKDPDSAGESRKSFLDFAAWMAQTLPKEYGRIMNVMIAKGLLQSQDKEAYGLYVQLLRLFGRGDEIEWSLQHLQGVLSGKAPLNFEREKKLIELVFWHGRSASERFALFNFLNGVNLQDKAQQNTIRGYRDALREKFNSEDWLQIAEMELKEGRYEEGAKAAQEGLYSRLIARLDREQRTVAQNRLESVKKAAEAALKNLNQARTLYEERRYPEAREKAREILREYPRDSRADRIQRNALILTNAADLVAKGIWEDALTLLEGVPEEHKDRPIRMAIRSISEFKEKIQQAAELLNEFRFVAAGQKLQEAGRRLLSDWRIQTGTAQYDAVEEALSKSQPLANLISAIQQVQKDIDDSLAAMVKPQVNLEETFSLAKKVAQYPEARQRLYETLNRRAYQIFNEAGDSSKFPTVKDREREYKSALNLGRIIFELWPDHPLMVEKQRQKTIKDDKGKKRVTETFEEIDASVLSKAQTLMSHAAANIWLPELIDDYFIVRAMRETEDLRYERERMMLGLADPNANIKFQFHTIQVSHDSFTVSGFQHDMRTMVRYGDTFTLADAVSGKELPSSYRVKSYGKNFVRLEIPPGYEHYDRLRAAIQEFSQKPYRPLGSMTLLRNTSWHIQERTVTPVLQSLKKTTKQKLDPEKIEPLATVTAREITGNETSTSALDRAMGLLFPLPEAVNGTTPAAQKPAVMTDIDRITGLINGLEDLTRKKIDPEQQRGLIDVLSKEIEKAPVFIHGPAGTGKSTMIIWAIYLFYIQNAHIRMTAQQNEALDNIIERIIREGWDLFGVRLGNDEDVISDIALQLWDDKDKRIEGLVKRAEGGQGTIVYHTAIGAHTDRDYKKKPTLWDQKHPKVAIIDEATRATRFETLTAILRHYNVWKIILVGDPVQLEAYGITENEVGQATAEFAAVKKDKIVETPFGGRMLSDIFEKRKARHFSKSLFERASEIMTFEDGGLFKQTRQPYHVLIKQRRSKKNVVESQNYHYKKRGITLVSESEDPGLFVVEDTAGKMPENSERKEAIFNSGEVLRVLQWAHRLMNDSLRELGNQNMTAEQIAIIPTLNAQIAEIQKALEEVSRIHALLTGIESGQTLPQVMQQRLDMVINAGEEAAAVEIFQSQVRDFLRKPDGQGASESDNPSNYFKKWVIAFAKQKLSENAGYTDAPSQEKQKQEELYYENFIKLFETLIESPLPETALAVREAAGLGANFYDYHDIMSGKHNLLSVDASIGHEFDAAIISYARSNSKGRYGFLGKSAQDPDDDRGEKRRVVAGGRGRNMIHIGDFSMFERARDPELRDWAKHNKRLAKDKGVFISHNGNGGQKRSEMRQESEKVIPQRSEAREIVADVLIQMARGRMEPSEEVVRFWEEFRNQPEQIEAIIREEAPKLFDRVLDSGSLEIPTDRLSAFAAGSVMQQLESWMRDYLDSKEGNLNFAWAMTFSENPKIQQWLRAFLEKIETLSEQPAYQGRIDAKIAMIVSEADRPAFETFLASVPNRERLIAVETKDPAVFKKILEGFLSDHSNALIYGLPDFLKGLIRHQEKRHNVSLESGLLFEEAFPAFALMNFITAQHPSITAELLREIPQIFTENVIRYNGSQLVVLSAVRDFAFEHTIAQMFAVMA